MNRRALLKAGAAAAALAAIGGGAAFQAWRARGGRRSERITGPWPELGPRVSWLLPDLHDARMVVPDRPHDVEEARDAKRRDGVRRTRTFYVNSSARRLRGDALGPTPAPGFSRILAIGDSVTFGWGVADDESWPAQLAAELARRGKQVEVLNAGVPAQRLDAMQAWLQQVAPGLQPSVVLFTRRPYPEGQDPIGAYASVVQAAERALPRAKMHVLLPPVSRFDPHGNRVWKQEADELSRRLAGTPVLDLTETMRAAQGDRGAKLEIAGSEVRVLDEGGRVLLAAPAAQHGLPEAAYRLFEEDASVREALFFDDGHPDAEGFGHLVRALADRLGELGWA